MGIFELWVVFVEWYEKWFGVSFDLEGEILLFMGFKEGLMYIVMVFFESGDEVFVFNFGYLAYWVVFNLIGVIIWEYKLELECGWLLDMEVLESIDLSWVKIMWFNYLNMLIGIVVDLFFLESIVAFVYCYCILIVNDNFYFFILNEQQYSILSILGVKDVVVEFNSFSKGYNMVGWCIGMFVGWADYFKVVLCFKSNMDFGMFKLVQLVVVQVLKSFLFWYKWLNGVYVEWWEIVFQFFDVLDCKYDLKQVGMFVWVKILDQYVDVYELVDEVLY